MKKWFVFIIFFLITINLIATMIKPKGFGTESEPYLISSLENLVYLSNSKSDSYDVYYVQTQDIDASNTKNWKRRAGFVPINGNYGFNGNYDGRGFKIINLYIDRANFNNVGLFERLSGATIKNLTLKNITVIGNNYVGGLCGKSENSTITNCFVDGKIRGNENVGAIFGFEEDTITNPEGVEHESYSVGCFYNYQKTTVNYEPQLDKYAIDEVIYNELIEKKIDLDINKYFTLQDDYYLINSVEDFKNLFYFARFSKYKFKLTKNLDFSNHQNFYIPVTRCVFDGNGKIIKNVSINCPNTSNIGLFGKVIAGKIMNLGITDMTIKGYNNIGGIAGITKGKYSSKLIENCFVQAKITGNENIGGLVGYNDAGIYYSYSVTWLEGKDLKKTGGLVGNSHGRIEDSYYNSDLFPNSKVDGKYGRTTLEMKDPKMYKKDNKDFDKLWYINSKINNGYPSYKLQISEEIFPADLAINIDYSPTLKAKYLIPYDSYDLYFGNSYPPTNKVIENGIGEIKFKIIGNLKEYNQYFWQVVLKKAGEYDIISNYSFTTKSPWTNLGTKDDPITISNLNDLKILSESPLIWEKHFEQTADIDASDTEKWNQGKGFSPIGYSKIPFKGEYDGKGFKIKNLFIDDRWTSKRGFFGNLENARVLNINLSNITLNAGSSSGAIAGWCNNSIIKNSHIAGKIKGDLNTGGLVGNGRKNSIENCIFEGELTTSSTGYLAGNSSSNKYDNTEFQNSYYIYENTLINGEKVISPYSMNKKYISRIGNQDLSPSRNKREILKLENDYYLISSETELMDVSYFGRRDGTKFKLTKDLDMTKHPNFMIPDFKGEFDGNGHTISNVSINSPEISSVGLFQAISGGQIYNLNLENVDISGKNNIGGLVGLAELSIIDNCSVSGKVHGNNQVGGIAGKSSSNITNCVSDAKVSGRQKVGGITGESSNVKVSKSKKNNIKIESCHSENIISSTYEDVGGIVGKATNTDISYCYANGEVIANNYGGGLLGRCFKATISNCYSLSKVTGKDNIGGLIGRGSMIDINNCYASGQLKLTKKSTNRKAGGLISFHYRSTVKNSFWDLDVSKCDISGGGIGKHTLKMKSEKTFSEAGWDFQNIWDINIFKNSGYPYLKD